MRNAAPAAWLLCVCLLAFPWLNPFADGPSAAVQPWLVALVAAAGLFAFQAMRLSRASGGPGEDLAFWASCAATAWLAAGVLSSVIGLIQYMGVSEVLAPWINTAEPGIAYANLRQRNQFATLTNMALAALLWRVVQAPPVGRKEQLFAVVCAVVLACGNAASSSRTGFFQAGMLMAFVAIWGGLRRTEWRLVLLSFGLAYAAALWVLPWLAGLDPLTHGAWARLRAGDVLCASRSTLWSNVLDLIFQRPWLGWGWGELDYAHYSTLYSGPRFCGILDNAHNLPLHLAVELGLPVAAVVCGGVIWLVVRARPWHETDPTRQMAWIVLAMIGLHSLLEYPLWYGPFQMAVGLCVVLLWRRRARAPGQLRMRYGAGALSGLLLLVCAYAAWDYYRINQIYLPPNQRSAAYSDDTLEKIRASWLFHRQVQFAELTTTPLTRANADQLHRMALELLHFSPEPRVIEKVIESAVMLGRDDEARFHLLRYQAAFPEAHTKWAEKLM